MRSKWPENTPKSTVKWPIVAVLALVCSTLIVGAICGHFGVLTHIVVPLTRSVRVRSADRRLCGPRHRLRDVADKRKSAGELQDRNV